MFVTTVTEVIVKNVHFRGGMSKINLTVFEKKTHKKSDFKEKVLSVMVPKDKKGLVDVFNPL